MDQPLAPETTSFNSTNAARLNNYVDYCAWPPVDGLAFLGLAWEFDFVLLLCTSS